MLLVLLLCSHRVASMVLLVLQYLHGVARCPGVVYNVECCLCCEFINFGREFCVT